MDIKSLKSRLDIEDIASRLGIIIGKHSRAVCPFHADRQASLQFSSSKQICTCFSSHCSAGTMDVVELVKKYNSWDMAQTLQWLRQQAGARPAEPLPPAVALTAEERVGVF